MVIVATAKNGDICIHNLNLEQIGLCKCLNILFAGGPEVEVFHFFIVS